MYIRIVILQNTILYQILRGTRLRPNFYFLTSMAKVFKEKNQIVSIKKANELVEARYKFDIWETRVFTKMLTMIGKEDKDFYEYKILTKDIIKDFSLQSNKEAYSLIKEGAEKLMKKIIKVVFNRDGEMVEFQTPIVGSLLSTVQDGENSYVEVGFHKLMKPYLLELKERYLVYDFKNISNLRSPNYVRIYELLKQYEKIGKRVFDLEDFKEILGITTEYKKYGHFKAKILDNAQKALSEWTDISFTYDEVKSGRGGAVTKLIFYIHKNRPSKGAGKKIEDKPVYSEYEIISPENETLTVNSDAQDQLFIRFSPVVISKFGVSPKVFMKLLENYTEGDIEKGIRLTEKALEKSKIENPAGYFIEAVRQKFIEPEQVQKALEIQKKKTKVEAENKEIELQKRVNDKKREAFEREKASVITIIHEEPDLAEQALANLKLGLFSKYYNPKISLLENMNNRLFESAFMNEVKKLRVLD
jgi:plasmid replication initiation protein